MSENKHMSENKQVSAAFVRAQKAFGPALKTHSNPAFRSKYADLSACIEAVIDALNNNGLALVQKQHQHDGGVAVETIFVHESGETMSAGVLTVPAAKQDPQGYGSALTYARRYSLMAACGIAPEDDDGNAASGGKKPTQAPQAAKPMDPGALADWLSAINSATAEELGPIATSALAAAKQATDRVAYTAIHGAASKRKSQLEEKK